MKKRSRQIVTVGLIIAGLIFMAYFLGLLALLGDNPQELTNFTNTACNPRVTGAECQYESILQGPENSINVTFQTGALSDGAGDSCQMDVKIEVYNYNTNRYDLIWQLAKSFSTPAGITFYKLKDDPYQIYGSSRDNVYYYACKQGQIAPQGECVYSNECINIKARERYFWYCVRDKKFLNSNYIDNGIVKFRTRTKSFGWDGTCKNVQEYHNIQIGYSDWGLYVAHPTEPKLEPIQIWSKIINMLKNILDWFAKLFS